MFLIPISKTLVHRKTKGRKRKDYDNTPSASRYKSGLEYINQFEKIKQLGILVP